MVSIKVFLFISGEKKTQTNTKAKNLRTEGSTSSLLYSSVVGAASEIRSDAEH